MSEIIWATDCDCDNLFWFDLYPDGNGHDPKCEAKPQPMEVEFIRHKGPANERP